MTYQTLGSGSALCSTSASFYKAHNAFFNYPEVGDQVFFYVSGGINHTGIVEKVSGSGSNWTSITTIEGNSSDSVARHTYSKGNGTVAGFGRPKWSIVSNTDKDEYTILDLEYQVSTRSKFHYNENGIRSKDDFTPTPRFDIIAIRNCDHKLCVIELKKGVKALSDPSGVQEHAESFANTIGYNKETKQTLGHLVKANRL